MPAFYENVIQTPLESRKRRDQAKQTHKAEKKPIGIIGESSLGLYGYEGDGRYYVLIANPFGDEYATKTKLSFNEAKGLFDAMQFYNSNDLPKPSNITRIIKAGRKSKLNTSDKWMVYFGKSFTWSRLLKY